MKTYIGVKVVDAEPLNLGDYNKLRGWTIPEDEDPNREGYLIKYPDGYISWSPKEIFEEAYRRVPKNVSDTVLKMVRQFVPSIANSVFEQQCRRKKEKMSIDVNDMGNIESIL